MLQSYWVRSFGVVALAIGAVVVADDKKPPEKPAAEKAPDMSAVMEGMQQMSAPGKEHEALKPLAGNFNCVSKFYAVPGQPPTESSGSVERKWIMGNRYLTEEFKGTIMGMPFDGFGITGYDKLQKFYHVYWIDSFGTGTWTATGSADPAGKVFTFTGENFDPMYMQKKKAKSTTEINGDDKHTMKMYEVAEDGKEILNFEMICTRK